MAALARELCVSERHLRRALERELGVSPVELAQTHRLLLAKRLLADTNLSITRVAYASGFQSLRRFNCVFRERYRMPPSALRRARRSTRTARTTRSDAQNDLLHLTLSYRAPLAWRALLECLATEAVPGAELVEGDRYGRTVQLNGVSGVVFAENAVRARSTRDTHVNITLSGALLPAIMPLLARLRHLFDLDAEPSVIDGHLAQGGLGEMVRQLPGVRIPGALDGFDVALRVLLKERAESAASVRTLACRLTESFGEPLDTGFAALTRLAPGADRIAEAGAKRLAALGVAQSRAVAITTVARLVADDGLRLEPGSDVAATRSTLTDIPGIDDAAATLIIMRALRWPDAFPASDRALQRAAGTASEAALLTRAEEWRPWRAYTAVRLWQRGTRSEPLPPDQRTVVRRNTSITAAARGSTMVV